MTTPSERQERVKEIERKIESLDKRAFHWSRDGVDTSALTREIEQLRAERDRLRQSSGGEGCPHCGSPSPNHNAGCPAYPPYYPAILRMDEAGYSEIVLQDVSIIVDDIGSRPVAFIYDFDRQLIGLRIYDAAKPSTPAEPNPPGSGEPVATDDEVLEIERKAEAAALLPSPSEGAVREAANAAVDCSDTIVRELREFGVNVAEFRLAIQSEVKKAILRTRATATGGGDGL